MKCSNCKEKDMIPVFTAQGVEIDYCPACKGIWLDKGEIFYFTKKPKDILKELNEAIKQGKPSERICPRTGENMQAIKILKGKITLDYSPSSGGIWFDSGELTMLRDHFGDKFKINVDKCTKCLTCQEVCPTNAIDVEGDPPEIQKEGCIACWYCEKACPGEAIEADWSMMEKASKSNLQGYIEALKEAESQGKFRPYIDYESIR